MPTDQLLIGRDGPQRRHVPIEAAPQRREQPLCGGVVNRCIRQDLDQLGCQFRPTLQLAVVPGSEDADDHPSGERVVEHAEHQLGVDLGPVGAPDDRRQAPAEESFGLVVEERFESLLEPLAAQGVGHQIEGGTAGEGPVGPAQEPLRRNVGVTDLSFLVGGDDGVLQAVEHRADARDGQRRLERSPPRHGRRCLGERVVVHDLRTGRRAAESRAGRRTVLGGQPHGEPHRLAGPVMPHLDAPCVRQRPHDVEAPPARCIGGRLLRRRVTSGGVTDLDTHELPGAVHADGDLELGCRMVHRVRGQLREHQHEGVRAVAAASGQRTEQEAAGLSDRRRGGRETPRDERHLRRAAVNARRHGSPPRPESMRVRIPVALLLPPEGNP